ncbi:TniQ family protein [Streptomyces sp. NPDC050982]|uniref:TniQ family protein n=1 Tax=Streptomyces sp. NPDC050982 TaxID=3154746 RepID=UPI0033D93AA9
MSTGHRTMPIRCAPDPGEALDSWLEFTAARLACPFTDVLSALGLPNRETAIAALVLPAWTIRLTRDERAAITEVTGVAAGVLAAMTLQPFDGHALEILPRHRRVNRRVLWGRAGSRFCPLCLADSGGRWRVAWRLTWSFACTRHHVLLADRCPACHRVPRLRSHPRRETPRPGRCSSAAPDSGPRPPRCHHPLTDTPATAIPADGPLAETQRLIDTVLTTPQRPVHWPLYGPGGAPLNGVLRDAKSLGALILNHASPGDLNPLAPPAVLDRLERYRDDPLSTGIQRPADIRRSDLHSHVAPGDSAATAVAVTAAFRILRAESIRSVAGAAQWLTDRVVASGRPLHPGNVVALGGAISPALEAALRCSRETKLMPVARLRHRTGVDSTRPPADHNARARLLPAGLWPEWTLRLTPRHANGRPAAQRAEELLAVACLLAGNTTPIRDAVRLTGTTVSSHNVSTFLATLTRHPHGADILRAMILLADHLDTIGAPIDYARRRALFTTRPQFIDTRAWLDLQRRLRSNPSPNPAHAHRWLFQTLTGSPAHLAHPGIAPATPAPRQHYQRFRWRILPAEAELLRHTARRLLDEHGIDEPLQWTPQLPDRALHGLQLPGPDPHSISPEGLHQAVPGSDFSIAQLARTLETTTAHVVHLLSEHPVDWSPPRFRHTQHTATRVPQWRTWYEVDQLSLQTIADREGTSLATIRLALRKDGVHLRPAGSRPSRPREK